jgi:hypothetical protein
MEKAPGRTPSAAEARLLAPQFNVNFDALQILWVREPALMLGGVSFLM